jgi:sugar phosphate isomerase/epimerase
VNEKWGDCAEVYPNMYKGTEMMMSAAKAVSAKSYDFDTDGNETTIDFVKMLQIVKDAGYTGFIGIEYEGDRLNEPDGIKATKDLLLKSAKKIK